MPASWPARLLSGIVVTCILAGPAVGQTPASNEPALIKLAAPGGWVITPDLVTLIVKS